MTLQATPPPRHGCPARGCCFARRDLRSPRRWQAPHHQSKYGCSARREFRSARRWQAPHRPMKHGCSARRDFRSRWQAPHHPTKHGCSAHRGCFPQRRACFRCCTEAPHRQKMHALSSPEPRTSHSQSRDRHRPTKPRASSSPPFAHPQTQYRSQAHHRPIEAHVPSRAQGPSCVLLQAAVLRCGVAGRRLCGGGGDYSLMARACSLAPFLVPPFRFSSGPPSLQTTRHRSPRRQPSHRAPSPPPCPQRACHPLHQPQEPRAPASPPSSLQRTQPGSQQQAAAR